MTLGSITHPALIPGFPVEVFANPAICDQQTRSAAADFRDPDAPAGCTNEPGNLCDPLEPSDFAIHLVFTPPSGPSHIVVLREDCSVPLDTTGCSLPSDQIHCLDPATTPSAQFAITEFQQAGGTIQRRMRFTYPDTTGLLPAPFEDLPLAGPLTVAVTRAEVPVPCGLATTSCSAFADSAVPLVTCADNILKRNGTCLTGEEQVDPVRLAVTGLTPPNRFVDLCPASDPSGLCQAVPAVPPEIRMTRDARGNVLIAMDYRDVLVRAQIPDPLTSALVDEPFPRILRGALAVDGQRVSIKPDHIESRSPNFAAVLPIFEPEASGEKVFGAIDAGIVFHRIFAKSCSEDPAIPCSVDAECTAGCGVENFPGLPSGVGGVPIRATCPLDSNGELACQLGGTLTLDALTAAGLDDAGIPAPVNECVERLIQPSASSRNDDPDNRDVVMTFLDRADFDPQPIGFAGADGLALSRVVSQPPFSFTTHDAEGDKLVFLQPEIQECDFSSPAQQCDRNRNNLVFDHLLRVVQLGPPGEDAKDLLRTPIRLVGPNQVSPGVAGLDVGVQTAEGFWVGADPMLNLGLTPAAISNGLVFFRVDPAANVPRTIDLANATADGEPGDDFVTKGNVSPDGNFVAFGSAADNILPKGKQREIHIFLKDLRAGGSITPISVKGRSSCADRIQFGNGDSRSPDVSANGRFVVFSTLSNNLLNPPPGPRDDTNGFEDVYVHDTLTCATRIVSVTSADELGNGPSYNPRISADGLHIVFESEANNLDPADANPGVDVFIHNTATRETRILSVGSEGRSVEASISDEGTAAFESDASLAPNDENQVADVYVTDVEDGGAAVRASVATDGSEGDFGSFKPTISASGRWVAFESDATTLSGGDTNGKSSLFVHDLETGVTRRVAVFALPRECSALPDPDPFSVPDGDSTDVRISADGRYLVYQSLATNLVPGGDATGTQIFVEDLETGAIARISQSSGGVAADADSSSASTSGDGAVVAFTSFAGNLGPTLHPQNAGPNMFVSAPGAESGGPIVLGIVDTHTDPATVVVLDLPAEHAAVSNGVAAVVAPGENVKVVRRSCGGVVGGARCDENCTLGCELVVEDLLRPGVSASNAIAISERWVCALVTDSESPGLSGVPVPACHEIGTSPAASLEEVAAIPSDSIQVFESKLVFTSPEPDGRVLYEMNLLASELGPQRLQRSEDVVLDEGIVCFTTFEADLGAFPTCDQNGDGDCDDRIMFASDPADATSTATSCRATATPCVLPACDPRRPHSVVQRRTCKFLSDEELTVPDCVASGLDRNLDGNCTYLTRRCTLGEESSEVVLSLGNTVDPTARENPVESQSGGDSEIAPACVKPDDIFTPLGPCPCPSGQVCSSELDPPKQFTFLYADSDGDGILDNIDFCSAQFNPDPVDFDQDGVPDACDAFVCGDGQLQEAEACDPGIDPVCCTAECELEVVIGISESAVNPDQQGKIPVDLLSSPCVDPTADVEVESLRFAAVGSASCASGFCSGGDLEGQPCTADVDCPGTCLVNHCVGGSEDAALCVDDSSCPGGFCAGTTSNPASFDDKNGDGLADIGLAFEVQGSGIAIGTIEGCVTGALTRPLGELPGPATFEARDAITVK